LALIFALAVGLIASIVTEEGYRPFYLSWLLAGILSGLGICFAPGRGIFNTGLFVGLITFFAVILTFAQPFGESISNRPIQSTAALLITSFLAAASANYALAPTKNSSPNRYAVEHSIIRTLRIVGMLFFGIIVAVPLMLMISGSLYTTPSSVGHDFTNLTGGIRTVIDPFRAYYNLFANDPTSLASNFFGRYFFNSVWVSLLTVLITLALAIPGGYSISRLAFPGQQLLSRSILAIYLIPFIVLVIPLFVMLTALGLRSSWGLLLVYPATTLPVALYMLQGYFRGLPAELEEAGLMDGCSRLRVIWAITIPLSLPAIASVALYVFMIAWNEFLIAFMLLSDQSSFTLPIGINSMNSSEVAEQDLMAAAVVATLPIVVLFLWAERYMIKGLTSGGVKG